MRVKARCMEIERIKADAMKPGETQTGEGCRPQAWGRARACAEGSKASDNERCCMNAPSTAIR